MLLQRIRELTRLSESKRKVQEEVSVFAVTSVSPKKIKLEAQI